MRYTRTYTNNYFNITMQLCLYFFVAHSLFTHFALPAFAHTRAVQCNYSKELQIWLSYMCVCVKILDYAGLQQFDCGLGFAD